MAESALTQRLIREGLEAGRPMRSLAELLAEHRALVAFAVEVRDAPASCVSPGLRIAAALLVARCEAPTGAKP